MTVNISRRQLMLGAGAVAALASVPQVALSRHHPAWVNLGGGHWQLANEDFFYETITRPAGATRLEVLNCRFFQSSIVRPGEAAPLGRPVLDLSGLEELTINHCQILAFPVENVDDDEINLGLRQTHDT